MKNYLSVFFICVFLTGWTQTNQYESYYSKMRFKTSFTDIARGNPSFYISHQLGNKFRLQYGGGLTMDDLYALNYWEGKQYKERYKFRDTRFSFALGLNYYPFPNHRDLYVGSEFKARTYYCADEDFFHSNSGFWIGAQRLERVGKIKIGLDHESIKGFNIDIGLGVSYLRSYDKWATYAPNGNSEESPVKSGKERVTKVMFCVDFQIGFGNKRY